MRRILAALAALSFWACTPTQLATSDLNEVRASPSTGAALPHLSFEDEHGTQVAMPPHRPAIAVFVDYDCAYLCGAGLPIVAQRLDGTGLFPGRDYDLVALPLDPRDDPAKARAFRSGRLAGHGAGAAAQLLTSESPRTIGAAARALGYSYRYDAANDQFAHSAVIYALAAGGKVTAVLDEFTATREELVAALQAPQSDPARGAFGTFASICYSLSAATGLFNGPVELALRLSALVLLAGLAFWIALLLRRRRGQ